MRRVSRTALGLFGVALVVAITALAVQIPDSPPASAMGQDVTLSFTIVGDPAVEILSPANHSRIVTTQPTINVGFQDARHMRLRINAVGSPSALVFDEDTTSSSGLVDITTLLPGYGTYHLNAEIESFDGVPYTSESDFTYGPIKASVIDDGDGQPGNTLVGDATVRVEFDEYTESFDLSLVGSDGKPFIKHVDLTPEEIERGYVDVSLPVAAENIANGEYNLVATAFDSAGDMLDTPYTGDVEVSIALPPATGVFALTDALSRDYTAIALLVFITVFGFAIIVAKRHRSASK